MRRNLLLGTLIIVILGSAGIGFELAKPHLWKKVVGAQINATPLPGYLGYRKSMKRGTGYTGDETSAETAKRSELYEQGGKYIVIFEDDLFPSGERIPTEYLIDTKNKIVKWETYVGHFCPGYFYAKTAPPLMIKMPSPKDETYPNLKMFSNGFQFTSISQRRISVRISR